MFDEMADSAIVKIIQGYLKGRKVTTKLGKTYYSFQGIPYAKPPVGVLRFKAPQLPEKWDGVRDALMEAAVAPHIDDFLTTDYVGEEDCLFLNVYTPTSPEASADAKQAVMVWIHGGGFFAGSGDSTFYGPDHLVADGVVLVTINYRLGALGFLSTGDAVIPGNNGMKDQVMALRWVQQNIAQFGGDPDNVTIFGESAGAVSVHLHMFSPMSKGLFHRVIAQSGSVLNPWAYNDSQEARMKAFRFGAALGCKTNDSKVLLDFLMKLSAKELVEGLDKTVTEEEKRPIALFFSPTNEPTSERSEAFLEDSPAHLLKLEKFHSVPFLTGVDSEEGMFALKDLVKYPEWYDGFNKEFKLPIPDGLGVQQGTKEYTQIAQKVKEFYFGTQPVFKQTWRSFARMYGDLWFTAGSVGAVRKQAKLTSSPIYFYRFAFDGILGYADFWVGEGRYPGVCHADELGYIFQTITNKEKDLDPEDDNMKTLRRTVRMWTNFAKTGNPTPNDDPLLGVTWESVTETELKYLNIDKDLTMNVGLDEERMAFWENIYDSLESSSQQN